MKAGDVIVVMLVLCAVIVPILLAFTQLHLDLVALIATVKSLAQAVKGQ